MKRILCLITALFVFLSISETKAAVEISLKAAESYYNAPKDKGCTIELNKRVDDYLLKKHLRIQPSAGFYSLSFSYNPDKVIYNIAGDFRKGVKYTVQLIPGKIDGTEFICRSDSKSFIAKGAEPKFEFIADRSVIELKSKQLIPVSFTDVKNFKAELTNVPAFFGPSFLNFCAMAEADEKRPMSTDELKNSRKAIEATMERDDPDKIMSDSLAQYKDLKTITSVPGLKAFLDKEFSTVSKGYIGSMGNENEQIFSLPADFRKNPEKGSSVLIKISENENKTAKDAVKLVQITDLSISYKFSANSLLVWVTSLEKGAPVKDAEIMLCTKSGNRLFPGKTDNNGLLLIKNNSFIKAVKLDENSASVTNEPLRISSIRVIAAATKNDSCFTMPQYNRVYPVGVAINHVDQSNFNQMKGVIFTERGVYKPGETVYWKAVFREYENNKIVSSDKEATIIIRDPYGETLYEGNKKLNEFGSCSGSIKLAPYCAQGSCYMEAFIPQKVKSSVNLGDEEWDTLMNRAPAESDNEKATEYVSHSAFCSEMFQIQEFEAPKHFAEIKGVPEKHKISYMVGGTKDQDYVKYTIKGKYYAGGVLRHAKVHWTAQLTSISNESEVYPGYQFGSDYSSKTLIESGDSVLDNNGETEIAIPVSKAVLMGLSSIELTASVLDVDGKAATAVYTYTTENPVKIGISNASAPDSTGQRRISVIATDLKNSKVSSGKVTLEVLQSKWFYSQKRGEDGKIYYNWTRGFSRSLILNNKIENGEATFYVPDSNSSFAVRAIYTDGNTEAAAQRQIYRSGGMDGYSDHNQRYRTSSGNSLELTLDKTIVKAGEKVKGMCTMPKPSAYALITVESDEILSAEVIKTKGDIVSFNVEMTDECSPNAYVGVMIPSIRRELPLYTGSVDSEYPVICTGWSKVEVREQQKGINISIEPENKGEIKAAPGQRIELNFTAADSDGKPVQAELAVGVVDESVLDLTGYTTPVLYELTNFFKPLAVFSGDLRISLISQDLFKMISTRALTGGGAGEGSVKADKLRENFKAVAYWNPCLITDSNGKASAEFSLPDNMTSYRIFVVAADKESGFDSKERELRVSKDFYAEPAALSYLTVGDKAIVPVTLHNNTKIAGKAEVSVKNITNVTARVEGNSSISADPESTSGAKLYIEADNECTEAEFTLESSMNGLRDAVKRKISVTTAYTMLNRNDAGAFTRNENIEVKLPKHVKGELEAVVKGRLNLSCGLWSRLVPSFKYLNDFGFDCTEQTASRLMVLASLKEVSENSQLPDVTPEYIDKEIKKGLNKLYKNQMSSGGFGYWPGSWSESRWATQYASFALTQLKKAKVEVDEERLNQSLTYIKNDLMHASNKELADSGVTALSVVNLTMNNKLSENELRQIKRKFSRDDEEAQIMLSLAEAAGNMLPVSSITAMSMGMRPSSRAIIQGWQHSTVRTDAVKLLICTLADNKRAAVAKASDRLAGSLLKQMNQSGYWGSTADTGFALFALSEYMKKQNAKLGSKSVDVVITTAKGTKDLKVNLNGITTELNYEEVSKPIKITSKDKTLVNWTITYAYPEDPSLKAGVSNGFTVQKTLENLSGNKTIKVGDIVKATVIFEDKFADDRKYTELTNLYVEDPIPAGFTAINPSLKNDSLPMDIPAGEEQYYCSEVNGSYPFWADHQEMKKDRVTAFKNNSWSGRFRIEYYMRAAFPGTYTMKPTQIGLMYEPDLYGRTSSSDVVIEE